MRTHFVRTYSPDHVIGRLAGSARAPRYVCYGRHMREWDGMEMSINSHMWHRFNHTLSHASLTHGDTPSILRAVVLSPLINGLHPLNIKHHPRYQNPILRDGEIKISSNYNAVCRYCACFIWLHEPHAFQIFWNSGVVKEVNLSSSHEGRKTSVCPLVSNSHSGGSWAWPSPLQLCLMLPIATFSYLGLHRGHLHQTVHFGN